MSRRSFDRLCTHRELAAILGVPTGTLLAWAERGLIAPPHSRVERTVFFRREDIDTYLQTGKWPVTRRAESR